MLVCREAARLISDSYQRPLRWRERVSLRLHLAICDACTNFKNQMRLLTDAARRFGDERQIARACPSPRKYARGESSPGRIRGPS